LPLGASYPAIAQRLQQIVGNIDANVPKRPTGPRAALEPMPLDLEICADSTGVGQPLIDVLNEGGLDIVPCHFTHGDRRTVVDGQVLLGKAWLVTRLKALLQQRRIHLPPQHPEAEAMARELEAYELRVTEDADDRYGAFKVGAHDDLVTALGLAVQGGRVRPLVWPWVDEDIAAAFMAGLPGVD
jgi:hypothetical protein